MLTRIAAVNPPDKVHLWLWEYTDEFGKRLVTRWRMSVQDAKHYKDAMRVKGSLETRRNLGSTSDFSRSPRTS